MARFFVNRPIVAIVLSIIMVLLGLVAMQGLPIAQYPEIVPPMAYLGPYVRRAFTAADGAVAKFKTAGSYSRDNVIGEFVKTVASTSMDYSFARACAAGVEAELSRTAAKS